MGRLFIILLLLQLLLPMASEAQLRVHFNRSVDTMLAYPPGNAARGEEDFGRIVADEIGRARGTVDVAMYSLSLPSIVDALIAARGRGVRVRAIGDLGSIDEPRGFAELAAAGIPVATNPAAPAGEQQPLMHHKFIIVDGGASAARRPTVVTGSWNATSAQTDLDPNNLVVIEDSAVAAAYLVEFEEMWGSSGDRPDTARGRFGGEKEDDVDHDFILADGTRVELRFSPSDRTASRIAALLDDARASIFTAHLTFTSERFASALRRRKDAGVDVRCIVDKIDDQGSRFADLASFADALEWGRGPLLHHKYAVIDAPPIGAGGVPVVITGSYNWTFSAERYNDEGSLFIHDERIANQFLQEFAARYREAGGMRPFVAASAVTGVTGPAAASRLGLAPWPGAVTFVTTLEDEGELWLYDLLGRECGRLRVPLGRGYTLWTPPRPGMYGAILRCGGVEAGRMVFVR